MNTFIKHTTKLCEITKANEHQKLLCYYKICASSSQDSNFIIEEDEVIRYDFQSIMRYRFSFNKSPTKEIKTETIILQKTSIRYSY